VGIAGVHQLHVGSIVQWLCVKVQGTLCRLRFKLYEAVNCCCQKRHHVAEGGSMYAAGHLHRCLVLLKHAMWGMCDLHLFTQLLYSSVLFKFMVIMRSIMRSPCFTRLKTSLLERLACIVPVAVQSLRCTTQFVA
jgi:hypothetical protein